MSSSTPIKDSVPAIVIIVVLSLLAATGAGIYGWSLASAAVLPAWSALLISLTRRRVSSSGTPDCKNVEWVYLALLLYLAFMLLPLPLRLSALTGAPRYEANAIAATRLRQAAALDAIDLPVLLFSATRNRAGTLRVLAICIGAFSCIMLARRLSSPGRRFLIRALIYGSTLVAWAGSVSLLFFPQGDTLWWKIAIPPSLPGPAACFVNQNHFGGFTAMLCPGAIVLAADDFRRRRWLVGILMALCAAVLAISVPLCESRGGLVAGLSALLILPVCIFMVGHRRQALWTLVPVIVLLLVVIFTVRPHETASMQELLRPTETASLQSRMQVWRECLANWTRYPLLGHGPNSFRTSYPLWRRSSVTGHRTHAENMYVETLLDGGILGTAIALWALAALIAGIGRARSDGTCELAVYYAVLGALVVAGVHALVEFAIYVPLYALTLGALIGLALPPPDRQGLSPALLASAALALVIGFTAPVLYKRDSIYAIPKDEPDDLARAVVWAPTSHHAWFYAGKRMMRSKKDPVKRLGERFMTQSMVYDPKNYRHWRQLGELRLNLKDREGARKAYEEASELRDWVRVPAHLREDG